MLAGGLSILFLLIGAAAVVAAALFIVWRQHRARDASKLSAPVDDLRSEQPIPCSGRNVEDTESPEAERDGRTDVAASGPDEPAPDGPGAIPVELPQRADGAVQDGGAPLQTSSESRRAQVPAAGETQHDSPSDEPTLPEGDAAGDDGAETTPASKPVQEDDAILAPGELASTPGVPHERPSAEAPPAMPPRRPARHRDRRGARRAPSERAAPNHQPDRAPPAVRQAEAKLRLAVDWTRKTARLSVVLLRPDGFPDRIEADVGGTEVVHAFDDVRYDDIDIDWTPQLLAGELRLTDSVQRLEWLRSYRPFHLFAAAPGEPDLLSVSTARPGIEHAVICREDDIEAVHAAAAAAGSPPPKVIQGWQSIPAGWSILTGYAPEHAFQSQVDTRLRPLDPGAGTEIRLVGGLAIRTGVYAEAQLPRIIVEPLPDGGEVLIGGHPASRDADGGWTAPGWNAPGSHLVDVVPGPSLTYHVLIDPADGSGWEVWDAHPSLVSARGNAPWTQAAICGARVYAADGCTVIACESGQSAVALGGRANVQPLTTRAEAPAAVAILRFRPAFLIVSSGPRRHQGKIIWLGGGASGKSPRMQRVPDLAWVSAVRAAAARRLAVCPDVDAAKSAWRSAAASARRVRRRKA